MKNDGVILSRIVTLVRRAILHIGAMALAP